MSPSLERWGLGFGRYWYRVSADTTQYRRYRYRPILFAVLVPDTINTTSVHQSNNALKLFGVKSETAHAKRPSHAGTWRKRRECHLAEFRCTAHTATAHAATLSGFTCNWWTFTRLCSALTSVTATFCGNKLNYYINGYLLRWSNKSNIYESFIH